MEKGGTDPVHRSAPSPWVVRFAPLAPRRAAGGGPGDGADDGTVLDLGCGAGRHTALFLKRGHPVVAVDRDVSRLRDLKGEAGLEVLKADLEAGPWPLGERRFAAVVVTNYLHRPLLAKIIDSVAERGVLIYETFARGNERFGRPRRPDFLLAEGELLEAVRGRLAVVAYEHGIIDVPRPAVVQRIAAVRGATEPQHL
jgi:SAM-dependent methyltransferase